MHMMWSLPPTLPDATEMQGLARGCGVGLYPMRAAAAYEQQRPNRWRDQKIVLGYTGLSALDIREAMALLAQALARHVAS